MLRPGTFAGQTEPELRATTRSLLNGH